MEASKKEIGKNSPDQSQQNNENIQLTCNTIGGKTAAVPKLKKISKKLNHHVHKQRVDL